MSVVVAPAAAAARSGSTAILLDLVEADALFVHRSEIIIVIIVSIVHQRQLAHRPWSLSRSIENEDSGGGDLFSFRCESVLDHVGLVLGFD
jgi:hypothetical protein